MLDFYEVLIRMKGKRNEVYPEFRVIKSKDLMVRGGQFYAVWNPDKGLWSQNAFDLVGMVDRSVDKVAKELEQKGAEVSRRYLQNDSSGRWAVFQRYLRNAPDNWTPLDPQLAFANTKLTREDYVSKRMPYSLEAGVTKAFDTLFGTLYEGEELEKLMWAIGSVLAGESPDIQKFYVLYGLPGTGKSTVLNLLEELFKGHTAPIEAASLTSVNNRFALEPLMANPLVAYDHEADLSRIQDNSMLASIVSHDPRIIDAKYQRKFSIKLTSTLFLASNKPVQITEKGSGIIRRLIDIRPTNRKVSPEAYAALVEQLKFELGAIAYKCVKLFRIFGPNHYNDYVPRDMIYRTNVFFNFVYEHYPIFRRDNWVTLKTAWKMYKEFCEDSQIKYRLQMMAFRDEMREYWDEFHEITRVDGKQYRSVYKGFKTGVVDEGAEDQHTVPVVYDWLDLKEQPSIFDTVLSEQPAQPSGEESGKPRYTWDAVTAKLRDISTDQLHYVLPPKNLITIDFDMKGDDGSKSLERNLQAAKAFPATYAEVSKGGGGLHLHYYYDGDVDALSRIYEEDIEILKPVGLFSIRRKLSLCNDQEIATINSGLPLKPDKGDSMVSKKTLANERSLRTLLLRNLHKEIHPATKPSVDFMAVILQEAFDQGMRYDVTDMKPAILEFASNSTNQPQEAVATALAMPFASAHTEEEIPEQSVVSDTLIFFDVEVFPNLLVVCWKQHRNPNTVTMINPAPAEVEELMRYPLVGFNNRRYDNHILYARSLGYSLPDVYNISKRIVEKDRTAFFREAYGISWTDVFDYAATKKNLKRWEVELRIFHAELDLDWNAPVDEELWEQVAKYCVHDVEATEAVHEHLIQDYHARQILADLSGLSVNDTTARHTARIVFGKNRNHKDAFKYPDLSEEFPGYLYDKGESTYRGEVVGEGGYVYAEPGMYNNVAYMDITSMHPKSLVVLNLFGPATGRYAALMEARILIKEGNLEAAGRMFDGALAKYLKNPDDIPGLAYALKIALNIVYGYTAASFENDFRDPRNKDNVVAKRGALFMIDLKHALQERGCKPIHFKTDSVKIADYTAEDLLFVGEFGKKYGYSFGLEGVYERMALVNDAVLIGKWVDGEWDAVGARFAKPYVFKTLFSKEKVLFEDLIETRAVKKGSMYIEADDGEMTFVGRIGTFCPMKTGGGMLYRINDEQKYAVAGTKGWKWLPSDAVDLLGLQDEIDMSYFEAEVEAALAKIAEVGDPTIFLGESNVE
jgi:hypothetical protein